MRKVAVLLAILALLVAAAVVWSQVGPGPDIPGPAPVPRGPGPGGPGGPGIGTGPGPGPMGPMFRPGPMCPTMTLMPPPPRIFEFAAEPLQLTDEQREKLRTIMEESEKTRGPLMEKLRKAAEALRPAVLADQYDAKKIQDLASKAAKAEQDLVAANVDVWTKIRGVLTTEQVKKLREFMMSPPPGGRPGGPPVGPPPGGGPPPVGPPPGGPPPHGVPGGNPPPAGHYGW